MKTIKGPAIFLAQFLGDTLPFDNLAHLAAWAKGLGYEGIQVPADPRLVDLEKRISDELLRVVADAGVCITELSTHLQGQLVAVHPTYDTLFDGFAAAHVRGNPAARTPMGDRAMKFARGSLAAPRPRHPCYIFGCAGVGRISIRGRSGRRSCRSRIR